MSDALLRLAAVQRPPLADVSLEVHAGELVGVVGAGGAGKTTLLQLAAGAVAPHRGSVTVAGWRARSIAARRIAGFAPSAPRFPPGLTVRALLEYYARFHGAAAASSRMVGAALELAELGAFAQRRPATLPFGVLRRVGLAQAALGARRLLLLDETLDGSDPALRRTLGERLGRLVWNGGAVVLATQDLAVVERLADRLLVLHQGRVVRDAPAAVLLRDRVLEIVLDAPPPVAPAGFRLAPFGVEADLRGRTVEAALAQCRAHRLVVRGTRVRSRSLEDVVVETSGGS
jgi:ABC-type multidrug transport system ATPase subunit